MKPPASRTPHLYVVVLALLLLAPSSSAEGQEPAVSVSIGVDTGNRYEFRGIPQEDSGAIVQPWIEVGVSLPASLSLAVGQWNSLHMGPTGDDGDTSTSPRAWYESDFYTSLSAGLGALSAALAYTAYTSPNSLFSTVSELGVSVAWDDSGLWGEGSAFAGLQPSLSLAHELAGSAFGGESGTFASLALAPSLELLSSESLSVAAGLSAEVGSGLGGYYDDSEGEDDGFGYLQVGASLSVGLGFVPAEFGELALSGGLSWLMRGSNLSDVADEDSPLLLTAGLALSH